MDYPILMLFFGVVAICSFALALIASSKQLSRLTVVPCFIAIVFGLVIYGCSYLEVEENIAAVILRTVFSVCRMFIGDSDCVCQLETA